MVKAGRFSFVSSVANQNSESLSNSALTLVEQSCSIVTRNCSETVNFSTEASLNVKTWPAMVVSTILLTSLKELTSNARSVLLNSDHPSLEPSPSVGYS